MEKSALSSETSTHGPPRKCDGLCSLMLSCKENRYFCRDITYSIMGRAWRRNISLLSRMIESDRGCREETSFTVRATSVYLKAFKSGTHPL